MPQNVETKKKHWPQLGDLVKWWIFYRLDEYGPGELSPKVIGDAYHEVLRTALNHPRLHHTLYQQYEEFRNEFQSPYYVDWTVDNCKQTNCSGWSVFDQDDGSVTLQKIDDPDLAWHEAHDDNPPHEYDGKRFDSDEAAAAYVQACANEGDSICRKAIEFLMERFSPSVEEFGLERTWKLGDYDV